MTSLEHLNLSAMQLGGEQRVRVIVSGFNYDILDLVRIVGLLEEGKMVSAADSRASIFAFDQVHY